jgi:hypothetical protein
MIRRPLRPTDVELIVIRAMHDQGRKASCLTSAKRIRVTSQW